jgi:VanZ family protein
VRTNTGGLLENKFIAKLIKLSTQLYIGWIVIIAVLTLIPGKALPQFDWNFLSIDKIIHFSIFCIMTFLGAISLKNGHRFAKTTIPVLVSLLIAIFYGTFLELMQSFIPNREFDYADLAANIGGSAVGVLVFLYVNTKISK